MDNLENFPSLVDVLEGIDKSPSFAGFHAFSINVIPIESNSHHEVLLSSSRSDGETTSLVSVHSLFIASKMQR